MQTATDRKPILMPCPLCNEPDACVQLNLANLDGDGDEFHCQECDSGFGRPEIAEAVSRWAKWGRLLAWVDDAPHFDCE